MVAALGGLLALALGSAAGAASPSDAVVASLVADFRINSSTTYGVGQSEPAVAWNDTQNQYFVVWADERDWGSRGQDIYGRAVSSSGSPVGSDTRICGPNATKLDGAPAVAWNATDNEYLVVWEDSRNLASTRVDIYGRLVNASGVPQGVDFRISGAGAAWNESHPAVAWNATRNQYLVVWADDRQWENHPMNIYARRLGADGARLGGEFQVSASWDITIEPAVAWNATNNQYLVVWEDWRNVFDIYGRRVRAGGTPIGTDIRISAVGAEAFTPAVAWNPTKNQYLVVWEDDRNESTRGLDVYGRRVAARGVMVGGERRFSGTGALDDDYDPAVAFSKTSGQFLVVWEDYRSFAQNETEIYGRRMSSTGTLGASDFRISDAGATIDKERPALAWNDDGNEYLVAWGDDRNFSTSFWDVYGRRVTG